MCILSPGAQKLRRRRLEARIAVLAAKSVANPAERRAAKKSTADADKVKFALMIIFDRGAWSPNLV